MNGKRQKQAVLSSLKPEVILAFLFGVTFCSVLAYAGLRKEPITTDSGQFFFLRVLAALSAAGVASVIPGFLHLQLSPARILQLRAGGALAVFAIVYFVNPPIVVSKGALPPDKKVSADILAHLTSTPTLHWNTPVLQDWSHDTERGEANRPYEITSQLADDNFKHYHRGAAIYKLFGNDEWRFNRLFVSEDSTRLLDGPPLSAEYLKKVVMDAGREPRTLPFLWNTVWVYEIRIPKDRHFERISTNEFMFDAVIVCDQRSGSDPNGGTKIHLPPISSRTPDQYGVADQDDTQKEDQSWRVSAPTQGLARTDRRRLRTALVNSVPIVLVLRQRRIITLAFVQVAYLHAIPGRARQLENVIGGRR